MVGHFDGHFITVDCYVCGEAFEVGCSGDGEGDYGIAYELYADDGTHCGAVCYGCIQLPAEAIKAHLHTYAESVAAEQPQHAAAVRAMPEEDLHHEWIVHFDIATGRAS